MRSGRGTRLLAVAALALALGAAVPLEAAPSPAEWNPALTPPPPLPDVGTFDLLLFHMARPPGPDTRGMLLYDVNLALRAGAVGFLPIHDGDLQASWEILAQPAMNAPLSDLPMNGHRVLTLLVPDQLIDAQQTKVRDVGALLAGEHGPVQRIGRVIFGGGPGGEVATGIAGGLAAFGLALQMGTAQAQALGFSPTVSGNLLGDQVWGAVGLRTEKKLENAMADAATRVRLYRFENRRALGDVMLEGGLTWSKDAPTPEQRLAYGWVRLKSGGPVLDTAIGAHLVGGDPRPWTDLDATLNGGPLRLRLSLSLQQESGLAQVTSIATGRGESSTFGLFLGAHTLQGMMAGVMGMAVF